jgi:hypothetical protein
MSPAQHELLADLNNKPVYEGMENPWASLVDPLADNIAYFLRTGLLEESGAAEKLNCKFRVADLKPMLKQHGAKASGKKADLIMALLKVLPPVEVTRLVGDLILYHATPSGQQVIDAYLEEKSRAWAAVEADALAFLVKGDPHRAARRIAEHDAQKVFPSGPGFDWSLLQAVYLVQQSYDDLPLEEGQRRLVGAHLALSALLGSAISHASKQLLSVTGGQFSCTSLAQFLQGDPQGSFAGDFVGEDDPASLAYLYAHTKLSEATEMVKLKELVSTRFGRGIEIRHDGGCKACDSGRHKFRWSELRSIPKLPRHWGCDCYYEEWW